MKLLIVSAWYKPFVHPRAHRWSALAEYWAKKGHEVHVITARVNTPKGLTNLNGVFVHRVGFDSLKEYVYQITGEKNGRGRVDVKPAQATWYWAILEWLYRQIWKRIYFPDDTCIWYFPAKRKLLKLLSTEKFDGLITVSLPFTDHLLGLAAKEKYLGLPWIADTGDPFSFQAKAPNSSFLYTPLNKKLEKEVRDAAKKLEQGSETQQQLEKMANDLATTSSRAAFYETAHSAGVKNLPLAYVAARESGLLTDDGTADMKGIKERFPELFTSTAPPPGNAGEGTQTPPPNSEPDMDTFIRRAAGR